MKDRYGREFNKEEISNKDQIDYSNLKSLDDFSEEEIEQQTVLIVDPTNNKKRLYTLLDLQGILRNNHYSRLPDPLNANSDLLKQLPDFKPAIEFGQNAAHYNAYVLNKYPEFIPLLTTYVEELLNSEDLHAVLETEKNSISANHSKKLDKFFQVLAEMPEEKQKAFYSLFFTNRTYYTYIDSAGAKWANFPAKWEPNPASTEEMKYYNHFTIKKASYTPYPYLTAITGDFITNPENSCLHSWGMDVLYLLLEYHLGTNKPFKVFNSTDNEESHKLEQVLSDRISTQHMSKTNFLDPQRGQQVFEQAKELATRDFSLKPVHHGIEPAQIIEPAQGIEPTPGIESAESKQMKSRLENQCSQYMNYILNKLTVKKDNNYPLPNELPLHNEPLVKKYQAVYELYSALKKEGPGINSEVSIQEFAKLYNQKERQGTIAAHRDSWGIRLLNVLASILTCGIKNLISYNINERHYGFWSSKGANLNEHLAETLSIKPK